MFVLRVFMAYYINAVYTHCVHAYFFPDDHHHHFKERVSNRIVFNNYEFTGYRWICCVCVSIMLSGVCIIVKAVSRHVICMVCACIAFRCQIILACQSIKESGIFWMTNQFTRWKNARRMTWNEVKWSHKRWTNDKQNVVDFIPFPFLSQSFM